MQRTLMQRTAPLVTSGLMLVTLAVTESAFAAGPIVATATASVSNLQIQMTDFRPDDGIAAGGTWRSTGTGWMEGYCCNSWGYLYHDKQEYGDSFIDATPRSLSGSSDMVSVSRTADGARASFTLYGEHVRPIEYGGKFDPSSNPSVDAFYTGYGFRLSINPGTEITLTGLSTADASMNLLNDKANGGVAGVLTVAADFQMLPWDSLQGIEIVTKPEGRSAFPGGTIVQSKRGQSLSGVGELHESGSFTYVLRNNSQYVRTLAFDMYVSTSFYEYSLPVPEPSSWAMLLSGLGLMGAFARRRQAA